MLRCSHRRRAMPHRPMSDNSGFNPHGTTIVGVRRDGVLALGGDGQVTLGNTVMKGNARKVRRLANDRVLAGFAGGTADAFTLFERFEGKLEKYGNLTRAAIELAKDWRSDRYLRDRKSTRLNSSHSQISYAVFCLKKKKLEIER